MPSAAPESLRERRMAPPCAPGPRLRHATSWEVLLRSSHAFSTISAAPFTDVESTRIGSSDRASGSRSSFLVRPVAASVTVSTTESARGQMCPSFADPCRTGHRLTAGTPRHLSLLTADRTPLPVGGVLFLLRGPSPLLIRIPFRFSVSFDRCWPAGLEWNT